MKAQTQIKPVWLTDSVTGRLMISDMTRKGMQRKVRELAQALREQNFQYAACLIDQLHDMSVGCDLSQE
jgi:hypothetical protein